MVGGSGEDVLDHPHRRFVEEADEAVGREDIRRPWPGREGVAHRGGGRDDPVPWGTGRLGALDLPDVVIEQVEQQIVLALDVVVQGRRPDAHLGRQAGGSSASPSRPRR
ncbi:hypothetical protein [Streptomyces narbonensis]